MVARRGHRVPRPAQLAADLLRPQGRPGRVPRDRADPGRRRRCRCSRTRRRVRRGPVLTDEVVAAMAAAGLVGIEVDHPDHGPDDRAHAARLAADLGLVATGSSDYHGTNKVTPIAVRTTASDAVRAPRRTCPRLAPSSPTWSASTAGWPAQRQRGGARLGLAVERALAVLRGQRAHRPPQRPQPGRRGERGARQRRQPVHPARPRPAAARPRAPRSSSSPAGRAARAGAGRASAAAITNRAASRASRGAGEPGPDRGEEDREFRGVVRRRRLDADQRRRRAPARARTRPARPP